jgi:subtilisin family serine protease
MALGNKQAQRIAADALADPDTVSIEVDSRVTASTDSDPLTAQQWGLDAVDARSVWPVSDGSGVIVAVVDTGVDAAHEDLASQVLTGVDLIGSQIRTSTADANGHGTHVAGIIAAAGNGVGGIGVAPGAKILPVRVLDEDGAGYSSDVAEGIIWAVDHGASIVNLSLGGPVASAAQHAAVQYAVERGVSVFAAAGNSGTYGAAEYPAAFPEVIAVGAVTPEDQAASFTTRGSYVDLAAPGTMILSTLPGNGYAMESGTSAAAPFAAGVAAMLFGDASFSPSSLVSLLKATARDVDAPGVDVATGNGVVCARCAIAELTGATPAAAPQATPELNAPTDPVRPTRLGALTTLRVHVGQKVTLRPPRGLTECAWSRRDAGASWRAMWDAPCRLALGKVRPRMDGVRFRVDATMDQAPVYAVVRLRVVRR